MRAHFFNIETLVKLDQYCWIVDKQNPNIPIMKISQSDFKLIKSGIYKKQGNKVEFNGYEFWLPDDMSNKLKVKLKITKSSLGNIGISMQEFLNKDIINDIKPKFLLDNILHLKNKNDDIYIITSKQTKKTYQDVLEKLSEKLSEEGIKIKNLYYLSENFYNQKDDDIKYKKIKLLLQHLIGYRTEVDKFIDDEITQYDTIYYYDDKYDTLKMIDDTNPILKMIIDNTEDGLKSVVKEDLKQNTPILIVNQVSNNSVNKVQTKKLSIEYLNFIKTYEMFRLLNNQTPK